MSAHVLETLNLVSDHDEVLGNYYVLILVARIAILTALILSAGLAKINCEDTIENKLTNVESNLHTNSDEGLVRSNVSVNSEKDGDSSRSGNVEESQKYDVPDQVVNMPIIASDIEIKKIVPCLTQTANCESYYTDLSSSVSNNPPDSESPSDSINPSDSKSMPGYKSPSDSNSMPDSKSPSDFNSPSDSKSMPDFNSMPDSKGPSNSNKVFEQMKSFYVPYCYQTRYFSSSNTNQPSNDLQFPYFNNLPSLKGSTGGLQESKINKIENNKFNPFTLFKHSSVVPPRSYTNPLPFAHSGPPAEQDKEALQESQINKIEDINPYDLFKHSGVFPTASYVEPPPFAQFSPSPEEDIYKNTAPFNMEVMEVAEPTFIVPENYERMMVMLPAPAPPKRTHRFYVNDRDVVRSETRSDSGEFISSYTTADGTRRSERGSLVDTPDGDQVLVLRGSYSFTSPEGLEVNVNYIADQNGYRVFQ
ncbi:hypothetical protein J6590_028227 [Homalodisca vitripennis]|nr:hypothetical protein J6590_028227 [Homalodisca vitripennis]